jgi:hypothetical protein
VKSVAELPMSFSKVAMSALCQWRTSVRFGNWGSQHIVGRHGTENALKRELANMSTVATFSTACRYEDFDRAWLRRRAGNNVVNSQTRVQRI